MLLSNKKEQTTETHNMDETPKHYAKWKPQKPTDCKISAIWNSRKDRM